jgi:hypothetical protein
MHSVAIRSVAHPACPSLQPFSRHERVERLRAPPSCCLFFSSALPSDSFPPFPPLHHQGKGEGRCATDGLDLCHIRLDQNAFSLDLARSGRMTPRHAARGTKRDETRTLARRDETTQCGTCGTKRAAPSPRSLLTGQRHRDETEKITHHAYGVPVHRHPASRDGYRHTASDAAMRRCYVLGHHTPWHWHSHPHWQTLQLKEKEHSFAQAG